MTHSHHKRQSMDNNPWITQMLHIAGMDFKAAIILMLMGRKKNMLVMNGQEVSVEKLKQTEKIKWKFIEFKNSR